MQTKQAKSHSPNTAPTKTAEAPQKAAVSAASASRVPAWASGMNDLIPTGLVLQDASAIPGMQAKLTISQPNDPYEQEADRVAEQVMRMPASPASIQRKCACGGIAGQIGECESCAQNRKVLQRQTTQQDSENPAPPIVNQVLSSGNSQPLDVATRAFMEPRFGTDFSQVRVHTGGQAAESAQLVSALAYTVGNDVVFGNGQYSPETSEGQKLLAHELTHVVQQGEGQEGTSIGSTSESNSVSTAKLLRFGSKEHVSIGDLAIGPDQAIDLGELVGPVSYGEMIAMAGDYFESVKQILDLAQDNYGYQQIQYALWKVNPSQRPKPVVSGAAAKEVDDRYYDLAAKNETHFSTGSAPGRSNREQYIEGHKQAIEKAYWQGRTGTIQGVTWEGREAFANHFLTDAFAGGHIRTTRGEIQQYWNDKYPSFNNNLINMLSCYMGEYIYSRDLSSKIMTIGAGLPLSTIVPLVISKVIEGVALQIRELGGKKLAAYSFGDLLSKVMHDADNAGLEVISKRGPEGQSAWRAVGDEHLFSNPEDTVQAGAQKQTQQMVKEAVRLSYAEAQRAFKAGATQTTTLEEFTNPANFAALDLIPVENTAAANPNPAYNWRVAGIRDLPQNVKELLAGAFLPSKEIRRGLDELDVPVTKHVGFTIPIVDVDVGVDLHTGDAWIYVKDILLSCTIEMMARIGEGNVCPPAPDNCKPVQQPSASGPKSAAVEETTPEQLVASRNAGTETPPTVQTKLAISQPNDPYEQEADHVAEQVMRMPTTSAPTAQSKLSVMRKERSDSQSTQDVPPTINEKLSSGGQPLDANVQVAMASRFGSDFRQVQVRTGTKAAESAKSISALAYTVRNDVVFGSGQYKPETSEGQKLLVHELTHVVQQGGQIAPGSVRRQVDDAEAARVKQLNDKYYTAASTEQWDQAALILNGFSDDDINQKLNELSLQQLEAMRDGAIKRMPGWSDRIVKPVEAIVARQQSGPGTSLPITTSSPAPEKSQVRIDYPTDASAYHGIQLHYVAARDLPLEGVNSPGVYKSTLYWLAPQVRVSTGNAVGYVGYNPQNGRNEWVIGPGEISFFIAHERMYFGLAQATYPFGGRDPSPQQVESGRVVERLWSGDATGAFDAWVSAWSEAIRDPNWWIQVLASIAGGLAARGAGVAAEEAGELIDTSTPGRYAVSDPANPRFQAFATVEDDELLITMRTRLEDGTRSQLLNGTEQFERIVDHFSGRFTGIRGSWSFGDNLAAFNEATGAGASSEAAAMQTWTGQQAAAAGYTRAVVRSLEGSAGTYTKVNITFVKP